MAGYDVQNRYQKRINRYKSVHQRLSRQADRISNLRLCVFILGLGLTVAFYRTPVLSGSVFLISALIFIYLLVSHNRVSTSRDYAYTRQGLNENALKRLSGEWMDFSDTGADLAAEEHPYAKDLDVFGRGSLFQWISTAFTPRGREKLGDRLSRFPAGVEQIEETQAAVEELSRNLAWCQKFCAEGPVHGKKPIDPALLFRWAEKRNDFYQRKEIEAVIRIFPVITVLLIILSFSTPFVPAYWPILFLVGQATALFAFSHKRSEILEAVGPYEANIKVYYKMLRHLERKRFDSELLKSYQKKLLNRTGKPAYIQVEKLSKLADAISNRENAYFLVVNILTLWDYQCILALEKWKSASGKYLSRWVDTVGEVEALISLAGIAQIHPEWSLPEISAGPAQILAKTMGHPLINKNRVCNDLELRRPAGILLITGSNMSGKSTLLRTVGLNLVLAYAGARVCARKFTCSLLRIYTCMRVSDDLEKSISSFYAELLRIKMIVDATHTEGLPIFFLLDEIFKGTNSQDRHLGAKILIRQLNLSGAVGLVSTHDLELGEMERESKGQIKNYHFREYYENGKIRFDYTLRRGLSTTRNAMYLIKMAGIDVGDDQLRQ